METVTIRVEMGQSFARTLRFVKERSESKFCAKHKTWTVPANHRMLGEGVSRSQYPYEIVEACGC